MSERKTFELTESLPHGRLAIEASAGTGKTYTLSTLAARYVAEEGVLITEILVVTFTRAAAAELRDRVRARLVEFAAALAGTEEHPDDAVLTALRRTDRAERLARVQTAIAEFDSATITTIHGFAQQVIGSLGSAVPTDPDAVLQDDSRFMIDQVATDLLVAEAVLARHPTEELPAFDELRKAAGLAMGNPDAVLVPPVDVLGEKHSGPVPTGDVESDQTASTQYLNDCRASRLRALVDTVVSTSGQRRLVSGTLSFDDLLLRLRGAVAEGAAGDAARHALGERFRVALIDEFQDTDPVQWGIFDSVFGLPADGDGGADRTALVLVGDPKQAIYAFRGANVHTYLQAAHSDATRLTELGTNWRSDPTLLSATGSLLSGTTFGSDDIRFQTVQSPEGREDQGLRHQDGHRVPSVSIRLMMGPDISDTGKPGVVPANRGEPAIYAELAGHVRHLLETCTIPDERDPTVVRRLQPADVAVLIAANRQGPDVRDALMSVGIPAVISRGDNVLESEAAGHWHALLHALARPSDVRRVRAAALTWFFGWDAGATFAAGDTDLGSIQEQLHRWGEQLVSRGTSVFVGHLFAETAVSSRVLCRTDGDRAMTDLDHVAELLTLAAGANASPTTLLTTFEQLTAGGGDGDPEADMAARRVESASSAVQIMTTFVAKGLEFPVVCCPTLWNASGARATDNIWWDGEESARTIDVASDIEWGSESEREERARLAAQEAVGTNLRVLYVALTRARHHSAVWWLPTGTVWHTGLARVLFARDDSGAIDADAFKAAEVAKLDDEDMLARLAPVAERSGGALEVLVVDRPAADQPRWEGARSPETLELQVADLGRDLDRDVARWSFTAITSRSAHDGSRSFDPHDSLLGDAGAADEAGSAGAGSDGAAPSPFPPGGKSLPLGEIAGGAGFGTLVHEVLERIDFTTTDLESELGTWVDDRLAWNPWPVDRSALIAGLAAVIRTPLGPLFSGMALADLGHGDRLDELEFDLTLGEGGTRATDSDIGALLVEHLAPDDPQHGWAAKLCTGPFSAVLRGHLTGSVDLVARVRHDDGIERFVVCDYKTNRLAPWGTTATADHFRPDRLPVAMAEHHYQLQALLYSVALHRYLRWRLVDYDPAVHLGGVGYLFVRGMVGPDTPAAAGVPDGLFDWRPPSALVAELSDLLDGSPSVSGTARSTR